MPSPQYVNVVGTGHRRLTREQIAWLLSPDVLPRAIGWLQDNFGAQWGISGMALGFDQIWAEQLKAYGMKLHAMLPFSTQPDPWNEQQKNHWQEILDVADNITDVARGRTPRDRRQAAAMLHGRNDAMLNVGHAVVACWDRTDTKGGTWSAVNKAVQRKLPILWIDPRARTIRPTKFSDWADILSSNFH